MNSSAQSWRALRRLLARYLRPHAAKVAVLVALLLIDAAAQLALPRVLIWFVDGVANSAALAFLLQVAVGYFALAVLRQLANAVQAYLAADLGMRATNRLRADALQHVLGLDLAWHNATTPGALIERVDGDTAKLNNLLGTLFPQFAANVLIMAGAMLAFFTIDWRAGVLVGVLLPLTVLVVRAMQNPVQRAHMQERESASQLFGLIEERLAGTEDVRANGAVDHVMRRFFAASRAWGKINVRAHVLGSFAWAVPSAMNSAISVLVVALGVWLFGAGAITLGAVLALYRYTEVLSRPWFQLGRQISELLESATSALRLSELTALKPGLVDGGTASLPPGALSVDVRDMSFGYADGSDNVLEHVSFSLAPGRVLGLLGRTGSGKSTLTRLIARLYDHDSGEIALGHVRVAEARLASLRERVLLITQDVQVFSASVRDNVALYNPAIGDDAIWHALENVGLREWAEALPQNLDTPLAAGGSGLSAGQAQLLAFARAFTREAGLVIMDEASSRLDPATEQLLERAVDRLLHGRTAIIIAHRLGTVERADDILVLEDGRVAEFGARDQLAADPASRYYALRNFGAEEVLA